MKQFFTLLLICISISAVQAQDVPQGMQYQAIARDLKGEIIANQPISLKISLLNPATNNVFYVETHDIITSQLGLFNLVIGGGKLESGSFNTVPWGADDVWLQVSIKTKGQTNFTLIGNNKLFTVPYAFRAGTANSVSSTVTQNQALQADACDCKEGIKSVQVLYLGNDKVTIKVFDNKDLKKQIFLFTGKNNGDVFSITAAAPDKKLPNSLFVQITGSATVTEIPMECNDAVVGETFGNLSVVSRTDVKNGIVCSVCDIKKDWKVGGNVVLAACNMLGSKNKSDLVVITDNTERIRVRTNGDVEIQNTTQSTSKDNGALIVEGGVGIEKNLNVGGNTNVTGTTNLSSTLDVTGATHLKSNLTTDGSTNLKNTLTVAGVSTITDNTQSTNYNNGALVVTGGAGIGGNLNVAGSSSFASVSVGSNLTAKGLNIINDTAFFLATFQNTNNGDGDGINIKLGKAKSIYSPPALPTFNQSELDEFHDLIICDKTVADKLTSLGNIIAGDAVETGKVIAGIAVGTGNMIIKVINDGLHLPLKIGPYDFPGFHILDRTVLFPGLDLGPLGKIPELAIPTLDVPDIPVLPKLTVMPELPTIDLTKIGIPSIDISSLEFWSIPSICIQDAAGSTPLNNKNEFIRFSDKNDAKMGSIRAVSVSDWAKNYLNPIFLFTLRGALLSSKIDKLHARYHFQTEIFKALQNYATLGVEYNSGNGDYAEWLEREDKNELITPGDIIGVKGGKITKELKDAEQVMVVSHNPIMLGNMPAEAKNWQGNNIAFMGQVPVKIMGPVSSGDYILGQSNTPGYGVAKHPEKMSIEDFKLAVGRSWGSDLTDGPKMVNTVVGVHNNSFLGVVKELKQKADNNEARLKLLEAKVNMMVPVKSKISAQKHLQ